MRVSGRNGSLQVKVGNSNKGKQTLWRLEEESDRNVECHPYYLSYTENI
jgi:hypothetical protein